MDYIFTPISADKVVLESSLSFAMAIQKPVSYTHLPELKKVDYTAGDVKHQIGNTVKAACYGYRFQSFG